MPIDPNKPMRLRAPRNDRRRVVLHKNQGHYVEVKLHPDEPKGDPNNKVFNTLGQVFSEATEIRAFATADGRSMSRADTFIENYEPEVSLDLNKKIKTRDGRDVEILSRNRGGDRPLVVMIDKDIVLTLPLNGRVDRNTDSPFDLVNPAERFVGRRLVLHAGNGKFSTSVAGTARSSRAVVGVVEFTVEDGKLVKVEIVE